MRRWMALLLSLLIVSWGTVVARAEKKWGILRSAVENTDFAVDKLLKGQPVLYDVTPEVSPQEEAIFVDSFQQWTKGILQIIEQSGRADEFLDITQFLEQHPLTVSKHNQGQTQAPDIVFSTGFASNCPDGRMGCFRAHYPRQIFVKKERPDVFAVVTLHEVGHYFGLADQYDDGRNNADLRYSSDSNYVDSAVMLDKNSLSCDDADGFINLIDLRMFQQKGYFSQRAKNGWDSLCPSSHNRYRRAMTINRKTSDYWVQQGDTDNHYVYRENMYQEGQFVGYRSALVYTEPLELMSITQEDQVMTDSVTHRVTQIISPVRITGVSYEGKEEEHQEQGMLKRVFAYAGPYGQGNNRFMKVYVKLFFSVPGEAEREFGLPIVYTIGVDGSVQYNKDSAYTLTAEEYKMTDSVQRVTAKLQHEQILEMTVTSSQGFLTAYPATGVLRGEVTTVGGEKVSFSTQEVSELSPGYKDISLLLTSYNKHLALLTHFYDDFYRPLFFGPTPDTVEGSTTLF